MKVPVGLQRKGMSERTVTSVMVMRSIPTGPYVEVAADDSKRTIKSTSLRRRVYK